MIKGVMEQTFPDWELLILDDGSTDNTEFVVKEFNDERIKYYYTVHTGAADKRNVGISLAKSEYIIFLDSDDEVRPEWLEAFYQGVKERFDLVSCGYTRVAMTKKKLYMPVKLGKMFKNLELNFLSGTLLIRKEILQSLNGFDSSLRSGMHTDFLLRLSPEIRKNDYHVKNINKSLININEHSGARIRNDSSAVYEGTLGLLRKHEHIFKQSPELFCNYLSVAAINLAKDGKYKKSKKMFMEACRVYPRQIIGYLRLIIIHIPLLREVVWGKNKGILK